MSRVAAKFPFQFFEALKMFNTVYHIPDVMEGTIIRTLQNAGGPRSTAELAKGCRTTKEEIAQVCNGLSETGQVIKVTDSMWCFNPKFGSSSGRKQNSSFARRPPPRALTPKSEPSIHRLSNCSVPGASLCHPMTNRHTDPTGSDIHYLPRGGLFGTPPRGHTPFSDSMTQLINTEKASAQSSLGDEPVRLIPIPSPKIPTQLLTRPPLPKPSKLLLEPTTSNSFDPPQPITATTRPVNSGTRLPPRPMTPGNRLPFRPVNSGYRPIPRPLTPGTRPPPRPLTQGNRPPPRPLTQGNRPPPRPLTSGIRSPSRPLTPGIRFPSRPLTPGIRSPSRSMTSVYKPAPHPLMSSKSEDNNMTFIHPSRSCFDDSPVNDSPDEKPIVPVLSGSEKFLFDKIKSSNNPWTIRQLKQGGGSASHSLCAGLVEKDYIIKIDMGNEEPMYTVNPKKLASLNKPTPTLKRPPLAETSARPTPSKTPRFSELNSKISSKIAHDSINKNPVSAVIELGQALGWTSTFNITRESGSKNRKKFHMRLTMGPRTFDSIATNKKMAKQNAAELALRILHSENSGGGGQVIHAPVMDVSKNNSRDPDVLTNSVMQFQPVPASSVQGTGFFGKAGRFSYDTYNKLASSVHLSTVGRKVIAVFFVEDSRSGVPMWSPVSLGSGNRTVNGDNINFEGKTVNDSHAEITARRGLRRFLWRQLRIAAGKEENTIPLECIMERGARGLHNVMEGVLFHLFISTAPCGDSAIFPISEATQSDDRDTAHHPCMENEKQGLLRSKMESGQGTNPTVVGDDPLTVDGIMMGDQRLKTMSCSDKVSRWNVLGLQGCLLSQFLQPLYLSTLTLGCLYHHGHLSRAVCCRYTDICLPPPYRLNHPLLGCVPGQEAERELGKTNEMSMNWCGGDEKVEVLDGCRGRCAKGVVSRLSRVIILKEYSEYTGTECKDYNKVKEGIAGYGAAKKAYNEFVKEKKYGVWITKPIY